MTMTFTGPSGETGTRKPNIRILGAYKIDPTEELFRQAMDLKYGGVALTPDQREQVERHVRDELSSAILFEVLVENPNYRFDVGDFSQPGSDQVAYDEAYLSLDGELVVSRLRAPDSELLRIAFYLHFVDPGMPLLTSYGELPVPELQKMSDRLWSLIPYEPVS